MVSVSGNNLEELLQIMKQYNISDLSDSERITLDAFLRSIHEITTDAIGDKPTSACGGILEIFAKRYASDYHLYFSLAVCVFGIVANIANIVVLTRKDMVAAPINRILMALAVADMIVMIEYILYTCYYYLVLLRTRDFPYLGAVYMMFHAHISQILHTTSICLTLTLAIWRYIAISYPERSHILCTHIRCTWAIVASCVLAILMCAPTFATMTIIRQDIREDDEIYALYHLGLSDMMRGNDTLLTVNFWVYAVLIKLLPCCILSVISWWLIRTLFEAKKRKRVLRNFEQYPLTISGAQLTRKRTKVERRADRTTKMLVAVLVLFLLTEFPQGIFALLIGFQGKDLFLGCYQQYGAIMDILALFNSGINFILYCCMNRMFRATFGNIFKPNITPPWRHAPASELHTTNL